MELASDSKIHISTRLVLSYTSYSSVYFGLELALYTLEVASLPLLPTFCSHELYRYSMHILLHFSMHHSMYPFNAPFNVSIQMIQCIFYCTSQCTIQCIDSMHLLLHLLMCIIQFIHSNDSMYLLLHLSMHHSMYQFN